MAESNPQSETRTLIHDATLSHLEDDAFTTRALQEDIWGVTLLTLVTDVAESSCGLASFSKVYRLLFCLVCLVINVWLQVTILYHVHIFIVQSAVHTTQENYHQFHAEVFNADGSFDEEAWQNWKGPYMELCNLSVSKMTFTIAVLFLWTCRMIGEFRSIERLHRDVYDLAALPEGISASDMVKEKINDDTKQIEELQIIYLNKTVRVLIYVTIIIPKILICGFLLVIGCRWLAATESFADLILNALALEFVLDIDEHLYERICPEVMRERLACSMIKIVRAPYNKNADSTLWPYTKSWLYLLCSLVWSYAYLRYFQQVLPNYQMDISEHCTGWFDKYFEPICPPFSDASECFPYGSDN